MPAELIGFLGVAVLVIGSCSSDGGFGFGEPDPTATVAPELVVPLGEVPPVPPSEAVGREAAGSRCRPERW